VRGTGAYIGGTNGESQGVIPFLKLHNDQLVAVNQGHPRRKGGPGPGEQRHLSRGDREALRTIKKGPMVAVKIKHSLTPYSGNDRTSVFRNPGVPMEQDLRSHDAMAGKGKG
jgi:hypothetical protein